MCTMLQKKQTLGEKTMKIIQLLPFMENEEVKELALEIINGEVTGVKLVVLFPFLRSEDLDEIVDILIEKKQTKSLQMAIPFVSSKKVEAIYEQVKAGNLEGMKETYFLPFLGKSTIKSMIKDIIKQAKESAKDDVEDEDEIDEEDFETDEE